MPDCDAGGESRSVTPATAVKKFDLEFWALTA